MNLFKYARRFMNKSLKSDIDLYRSYRANIAMCIYNNCRKDGRLNHRECNDVAQKLIKLIFD